MGAEAVVVGRVASGRGKWNLVRDHGIRLATRTGVNTGEIVAGAGETLATGDALNVAARLEQAAVPGEILIGARTHELVAAAVETEPVAPIAARGKAKPVEAYRLLSVRRAEVVERRFDLPMIDREAELERLRRAFEVACTGRCCALITVVGEAGLGKSRLAEELRRALGDDATVLQGRCLPYGEGITYWPLVEILRRATEEFHARVIDLVSDEPDAVLIAGHLETAIAGDSPRSSDELAWAARKLFERMDSAGARRPEHGHHPVADELLDRPAVALERGARLLEVAAQQAAH
jgi:hypothetical protein